MRNLIASFLFAVVALGAASAAAADLGVVPAPRERVVREQVVTRAVRPSSVTVRVDELFLRAGGCPRSRNCIAPRVLPVAGAGEPRAVAYVPIAIPVDPRFAHRY